LILWILWFKGYHLQKNAWSKLKFGLTLVATRLNNFEHARWLVDVGSDAPNGSRSWITSPPAPPGSPGKDGYVSWEQGAGPVQRQMHLA
jgi:hypothetical protein